MDDSFTTTLCRPCPLMESLSSDLRKFLMYLVLTSVSRGLSRIAFPFFFYYCLDNVQYPLSAGHKLEH